MPATVCRRLLKAALTGLSFACGDVGRGDAPLPLHRSSLLQELAAIGPAPRRLRARLSLPTRYVPCRPTSSLGPDNRSGCIASWRPPSDEVLGVASRAAARVRSAADADAMHAATLVDVVWGDSVGKVLDRSISNIRAAASVAGEASPESADLGALLIERAERHGSTGDLLEGLEVTLATLEKRPGDVTVLFNLAIALDALGLDGPAHSASMRYLALDANSQWSQEIRAIERRTRPTTNRGPELSARREVLSEFAAERPREARELAWDVALGRWGRAVLEGDSLLARICLAAARVMGERLAASNGDATLADAVRTIDSVSYRRAGSRALATAHAQFALGRAAYEDAEYGLAAAAFEEVAMAARTSVALRQWAQLFSAPALVYLGRADEGLRRLRRVVAEGDEGRAPALIGRAHWASGTVLLRLGRHDEGIAHMRAAERLFARIGETQYQGVTQALQAEALLLSGDDRAGYEALWRALRSLRADRDSRWLHNALYTSAQAAAAERLFRAARLFHDTDVGVCERLRQRFYLPEALSARARLLALLDDTVRARADVSRAQRILVQGSSDVVTSFLLADVSVTSALLGGSAETGESEVALDSAVNYFAGLRNPIREGSARLARAQSRVASREIEAAQRDLARVVELLDARSRELASLATRSLLLEHSRAIVDRLVMMQLADRRYSEALATLERSRPARSHGDRRARDGDARADRSRVLAVDYALIGDTLLTWLVRGDELHFQRRTVSHRLLDSALVATRAMLEMGADERALREPLSLLYDLLLRPVASRIRDGETFAVIADGVLSGVPFAALRDDTRDRYVVEANAHWIAPSLRDVRQIESVATADDVLLVSDPAFDAYAFPGLRRLPAAADEAEELSALYPAAARMTGARATIPAFRREASRAAVIHFAGHALYDQLRPERSSLVLAATKGDGGRLAAEAIRHLPLRRDAIVVLSACRTINGPASRADGFAGLAGAFLSAGAMGVVGSLWAVDDGSTRPLMFAMHGALRRGESGPEALRSAQLALMRSQDPALQSPSVWSAFRFTGG